MMMFIAGIAIGLVIVAGCYSLGTILGNSVWNYAEKTVDISKVTFKSEEDKKSITDLYKNSVLKHLENKFE